MAAEAIAAGREVELLHLTRPSGETIAKVDLTFVTEAVGYPFLGITRYALQRVLLGHLDSGDVELGARFQGLETDEAKGITELRFEGHDDVVRARAVIGADGRRCDRSIDRSMRVHGWAYCTYVFCQQECCGRDRMKALLSSVLLAGVKVLSRRVFEGKISRSHCPHQ